MTKGNVKKGSSKLMIHDRESNNKTRVITAMDQALDTVIGAMGIVGR